MSGVLAGPGQLGDEVLQEDVSVLQVQRVDDYLDELEQGQAGPPYQGAQAAGQRPGGVPRQSGLSHNCNISSCHF